MKYILLLATSFVLAAVPAVAQDAGLPALQKKVTDLQSQIDFLTTSLQNLKDQVDKLPITPDDGTAAALVGTWTGSANDLQFGSPETQFFFSLNGNPAPSFTVPQASNPLGQLFSPANVGLNPQIWLGRGSISGPITITITRTGMNLTGSGTNSGDPQSQPFTFSGIVLSNNLFLLRVLGNASGPCAPTGRVVFQGVGSLNAVSSSPPRRMTFTGSGIDGNCTHSFFRVALTKN